MGLLDRIGKILDWIGSWFTAGQDMLPNVSGKLINPPTELKAGDKGIFRLEF